MCEVNRFRRVSDLFERARSIPLDERGVFLLSECGDEPTILFEVRQLLEHHDREGLALDDPIAGLTGLTTELSATPAVELPPRFGRYLVRGKLGVGGMGVVYLAEQENPRRNVAVKVIRPGFVGREVLKRFELEAAVLGRLQHPGIAQIYEAGMHDDPADPRPFFAMEYVDGVPLLAYAREHALDVRTRLEILANICDAVEHAHERGIVHRDLKPGNVLVDKSGQPKVLDFGVARATAADLQVSTMHTGAGQIIGTVAYMSPEQVLGRADEIDNRSDVYALGVILFELISDRLPYELGDRTIVAAARVISEQEPTSLTTINSKYRGDLETIAQKA